MGYARARIVQTLKNIRVNRRPIFHAETQSKVPSGVRHQAKLKPHQAKLKPEYRETSGY